MRIHATAHHYVSETRYITRSNYICIIRSCARHESSVLNCDENEVVLLDVTLYYCRGIIYWV